MTCSMSGYPAKSRMMEDKPEGETFFITTRSRAPRDDSTSKERVRKLPATAATILGASRGRSASPLLSVLFKYACARLCAPRPPLQPRRPRYARSFRTHSNAHSAMPPDIGASNSINVGEARRQFQRYPVVSTPHSPSASSAQFWPHLQAEVKRVRFNSGVVSLPKRQDIICTQSGGVSWTSQDANNHKDFLAL